MKLRTQVAGAFVGLMLPGALLSAAGFGVVDRLIRDEVVARSEQVRAEVKRFIREEERRVLRQVRQAWERGPAPMPSSPGLAGWAAPRATSLGLDLLALVDADPQGAGVLSSAHLPQALGDHPPTLRRRLRVGETRVGILVDLVDGNPPRHVPVLGAAYAPSDARGLVWVYGGRRLDDRLLGRMARMAEARLTLRVQGRVLAAHPRAAPPDERQRPPRARTRRIALAALGPETPAELEIEVDASRLWRVHRRLLAVTGVLWGATFVIAVVVGAALAERIARPMRALSQAVTRVGEGDLDVQVRPDRSQDEVATLVTVFNQMTRQLAEAQEQIRRSERTAGWREVARRLAHEIRNPLSPMRLGMANLRKAWTQQHPQLDEILEESTRCVLDEVSALDRLVAEFSAFARLPQPVLRPADPNAIVAGVARLYEGRVRWQHEGDSVRPLPEVRVDRELMHRALINVIKNAEEALEENSRPGEIDIRVRAVRDGVAFEVADNGPGMPEPTRAAATRAYFTTKPSGTGLGLAIVEQTVEAHGGRVRIESEPGVGTRVELWIPKCSPQDAPAREAEPPP